MSREQLYASFLLDRDSGLEIALRAEQVMEATPVNSPIRPLPGSADFLEGIMRLRDDVIPIINLKRKFGLPPNGYPEDAKVAVVGSHFRRYGLLFDDIRDVLRVPQSSVEQLDSMLLTEESIVTDLIKLDGGARILELIDLTRLFPDIGRAGSESAENGSRQNTPKTVYQRYVVFACGDRQYGVPVGLAREICFLADIDETFHSGVVEGALQLRGRTIPVLNGYQLLGRDGEMEVDEHTRILVMETEEASFGLLVDQILEIIVVDEQTLLAMPGKNHESLLGICRHEERNILLLNIEGLLDVQLEKVKSMARLHDISEEEERISLASAHHLITENCYLVFSIGRNFAIEIKDVQEILETSEILDLPGENDLLLGVINLRGTIVPVLDLHRFYNCPAAKTGGEKSRLIIGHAGGQYVALVVDEIVTIYKQEEFHETPSLRPELQKRKDTLDRLIEFVGDEGLKMHVLVVNVGNIIRNHLHLTEESESAQACRQQTSTIA